MYRLVIENIRLNIMMKNDEEKLKKRMKKN